MNQTYELSMEKNFKFMSSYQNPVVKNSSSFSNYNMQQRKMSQVAGQKQSIFKNNQNIGGSSLQKKYSSFTQK